MGAKFAVIVGLFLCILSVSAQSIDSSVLVEEYSFGSFRQATRIVSGSDALLYIIDADENMLMQFVNSQEPSMSVGGFGWSSTSFDRPTGVATDGINVYVSDFGNHRVQRFDRKLNYISSLFTRDTSNIASRFGYPLDVALSDFGDLFVLDGENVRVVKFSSIYAFERSFGNIDAGVGKLQNPKKLVATLSRIFVGEKTRIVIFDYFGNYLGSIGDGAVCELNSFTLSKEGFLAASNDTLWWFSRDGNLMRSLPVAHLITGEKIGQIQDVAYSGDRLLILSPHRIHVFTTVD